MIEHCEIGCPLPHFGEKEHSSGVGRSVIQGDAVESEFVVHELEPGFELGHGAVEVLDMVVEVRSHLRFSRLRLWVAKSHEGGKDGCRRAVRSVLWFSCETLGWDVEVRDRVLDEQEGILLAQSMTEHEHELVLGIVHPFQYLYRMAAELDGRVVRVSEALVDVEGARPLVWLAKVYLDVLHEEQCHRRRGKSLVERGWIKVLRDRRLPCQSTVASSGACPGAYALLKLGQVRSLACWKAL